VGMIGRGRLYLTECVMSLAVAPVALPKALSINPDVGTRLRSFGWLRAESSVTAALQYLVSSKFRRRGLHHSMISRVHQELSITKLRFS
jgi:hypothetical protein